MKAALRSAAPRAVRHRAARKWSDAINKLNAWRKHREEQLEERRQEALASLPEAAPHLDTWRSGVAEASRLRDQAIAAAAGEEREALMKALHARSAATVRAETGYRSGEDAVYRDKRAAEAKAEAVFEKAVGTARAQHGVSEQYTKARRKAEEERDAALAAARTAYESAKEDLHRERHAAMQSAQKNEYASTLGAWSAREQAVAAAEATYWTAVSGLDKNLQVALAGSPAAKEIRREFAAKKKEFEAEYGRKEQRIFAELRDTLRR